MRVASTCDRRRTTLGQWVCPAAPASPSGPRNFPSEVGVVCGQLLPAAGARHLDSAAPRPCQCNADYPRQVLGARGIRRFATAEVEGLEPSGRGCNVHHRRPGPRDAEGARLVRQQPVSCRIPCPSGHRPAAVLSAGGSRAGGNARHHPLHEIIEQGLAESVNDFSLAVDRGRLPLLGTIGHDTRNPLTVNRHRCWLSCQAERRPRGFRSRQPPRPQRRMHPVAARTPGRFQSDHARGRHQCGPGDGRPGTGVSRRLDQQLAANPGREVTLEVTGDVVGARDSVRMHQVLDNQVSNALRYGSAETPVHATRWLGHGRDVRSPEARAAGELRR